MQNLLSTTIELKEVATGKTQLLKMPYSQIFWREGERISMEAAMQKLNERRTEGVKIKHLTLGEAFEAETKSEDYACPHTFATEGDHFNYWLRGLLGYDFSNVDERTYTEWYTNLNNGIETKYI